MFISHRRARQLTALLSLSFLLLLIETLPVAAEVAWRLMVE